MIQQSTWMNIAIKQAHQAASLGEVPVGAVVVAEDDTLLAVGHNRTRLDHDPSGHAEIIALRLAGERISSPRLNGARLYVTLEPCTMCASAIMQARLRQVIFGAYDPQYGALHHGIKLFEQSGINHRPEILGGIAEAECQKLLRDFFADRR